MATFTAIPEDTFEAIQFNAGVVLTDFDPASPALDKSVILCATTGGIEVSCTPTYSDLGEDVDNCPNNMMELKILEGWDCKLSFTSLGASPELIRYGLGAADISEDNTSEVIPRAYLEQTDFSDLWWVGDRLDGGCVAVHIFNGLATSGFALKTTKNGKGTVDCEIVGHVSITAQDVVPMQFYSIDPTSDSEETDSEETESEETE